MNKNAKFTIGLLLLLLASISLMGCTTIHADQSKVEKIDEIKEFEGFSKGELYNKTFNWVARTFNSANEVIQLQDKEAGEIICKGYGSMTSFFYERYYSYTMIINLKDNKIRVRFENLNSEQVGNVVGPDMSLQLDSVLNHLTSLKEDLFNSIIIEEGKSDW